MPAIHAGNLGGLYRWSSGCHETDNYKESISGRWRCLWYATRGILYYFFLQLTSSVNNPAAWSTTMKKWIRVLLVTLLITTIWLASWAGIIAAETHNMIQSRQNLDREPGQHIIARLLKFDGVEKILGIVHLTPQSAPLTPLVG